MADPTPSVTSGPFVTSFNLDLHDEGEQFFRRRAPIAMTGVALGLAFIGIGIYQAGLLVSSGPSVDYAIAVLLVLFGGGVMYVSLRNGLINPVVACRAKGPVITFQRRYGPPLEWEWMDPNFRLVIEDLGSDPASTPDEAKHAYFDGPGPIYGNMPAASIPTVLDVARTRGMVIRTGVAKVRRGRLEHQIRRILIRPPERP